MVKEIINLIILLFALILIFIPNFALGQSCSGNVNRDIYVEGYCCGECGICGGIGEYPYLCHAFWFGAGPCSQASCPMDVPCCDFCVTDGGAGCEAFNLRCCNAGAGYYCSDNHCCPQGKEWDRLLNSCKPVGPEYCAYNPDPDGLCRERHPSKPFCCGVGDESHCEACCGDEDCGFCKKCIDWVCVDDLVCSPGSRWCINRGTVGVCSRDGCNWAEQDCGYWNLGNMLYD